MLQRALTLNNFKKLPKPPQVFNSFMAQITRHAGDTISDGVVGVVEVLGHFTLDEGVTVTLMVALELFMAGSGSMGMGMGMNHRVFLLLWKGRVFQMYCLHTRPENQRQSREGLVFKYYTKQQYAVATRMIKLKLF